MEVCLAPDQWRSLRVRPGLSRDRLTSGFQELDAERALRLVDELTLAAQGKVILVEPTVEYPKGVSGAVPAPSRSVHDDLKAKLVEIGKLQKFLVDTEYHLDGEKLDVVWRRVQRSVPTYVFEIHVGGDIYHAMAKLKHAFDLWNSHIFLIAPAEEQKKAEQLLYGTFHEIQNRLKLWRVIHIIDDRRQWVPEEPGK